ncbi:uncharacterized protein LAESUDRAFT_732104 [Laetiporus sulphureus 93-53]|uniref:Uncharacterized protein n=1 Tax=Laetiporus sulphureus 93-53 TaxID=1314785 RepID=A0A165BAB0_9APHY|nr:uncharacterized protein LAESUDRAFT_732104 [Laetiporus sulphureus 93-53]KZT00609.1 hypothetical protein LAESUDRAFT_732104 [Laetiporus sulphureus 93-53]
MAGMRPQSYHQSFWVACATYRQSRCENCIMESLYFQHPRRDMTASELQPIL